jgi:UDP:flavonoid glycosyltransferase YjiC (YdhE family)
VDLAKKRKILYAVLNWGIGHASRSLPVLRELMKNNEVTVMSTGRSLELLRSELPSLEFIDNRDYSISYTAKGWSLFLSLLAQIPKILFRLKEEHKFTEKLVMERGFDRIISDNRYGIYSKSVPSYFITHQIRFKLPGRLSVFEVFSELFNKWYFRKYRKIFVPDEIGDPNLSGDLSHGAAFIANPKISYIGILADLNGDEAEIHSDLLFIISGPEPQRTIFEKKVLEQSKELPGRKIIVRGVTESLEMTAVGGTEIYSSVKRSTLNAMIRGAKTVICRPGYSSVMELISYGKKALFIPTPGQTEQEYLALFYKEKGYFNFVSQENMELKRDVSDLIDYDRPDIVPNKISGMLDEILS